MTASPNDIRFDEVGYWSEIKLDIIKEYAAAYSTIFQAKGQKRLYHIYVEGFAGPGFNVLRESGEIIPGSPLNALFTDPPFRELFLIDLDGGKIEILREIVSDDPNVHLFQGDCNSLLINYVFPKVKYEDYRRALCVLDPYGLHLNWDVIEAAGHLGTIDLFLNFPIMDMNRNALWRNPDRVDSRGIERMNQFWGDASWRNKAYRSEQTLFGPIDAKTSNDDVANAFRERLKTKALFKYVPNPVPMRNSKGTTIYYLFFASQKEAGNKIASYIFKKYENRMS